MRRLRVYEKQNKKAIEIEIFPVVILSLEGGQENKSSVVDIPRKTNRNRYQPGCRVGREAHFCNSNCVSGLSMAVLCLLTMFLLSLFQSTLA